ncbi:MAG: superoxide dismutase [Firmicutes bacterium]|nr:superoxide dismutase [Bacillota bacterium]
MELHHDKHLQTYIDNLNDALKDCPELQDLSLEQLIINSHRLPEDIGTKIHNNAGGVYNHRFFFAGMQNPQDSAGMPKGRLEAEVIKTYGSFDNFKTAFKKAALSVFGSGYAWLAVCRGKLRIITTANQDTLLEMGMCPVISLDVWEHAYYLKHYNVRAAYIDDWFNVVNWSKAEKNYLKCTGR